MDINLKLIETDDGSHTLWREDLNETFHSRRGAKGESMHVFVGKGLEYLSAQGLKKIRVFEIGFGTGLNALLTAVSAAKCGLDVRYLTLEPFPISKEVWRELNYGSQKEESKLLKRLHTCPWSEHVRLNPYFLFRKELATLEAYEVDVDGHDLIYYDAFAPSKQPEIWEIDNLRKCHETLGPGGVLVTYCANGKFKSDLDTTGFEVQTLPGAMGKKEMVRALKH